MKIVNKFIFKVPYPYINKRKNKSLLTLNNWNKIHWSQRNKIKNAFKEQLKEWFIPYSSRNSEALKLTLQLITPQRHIDAINLALVIKWIEDVLIEKNWILDDKNNTIVILPTIINKKEIDPKIKVIIERIER